MRILKILILSMLPLLARTQSNTVYLPGSTPDNTVVARNNLFVNGTSGLGGLLDTTGSVANLPIGAVRVRPQDSLAYAFNGKTAGKKWAIIGTAGTAGVAAIIINGGAPQTGTVSFTIPTNNTQLTNGSNYITAAGAPVQSVNGMTNVVVIDGHETKVVGDGVNINVTGNGTTVTPYLATWIGSKLDTLYRTLGKDSIQFVINGRYHSILDSAGGGGGGGGITTLNTLTATTQTFATGTAGSDFNISSSGAVHTFNFPDGSASNRGLITPANFTTFNGKQPQLNGTGLVRMAGTTVSYDNSTFLTANQSIAFTSAGDLTGTASGTTSLSVTFTINAGAVGLTKLANGPPGYVIGYDGSGNPAALAPVPLYIRAQGVAGDSLLRISNDTLYNRKIRDSLAFHHVVNADSSWTFYSTSALTSGHIFVGNVSNVATDVAMGGDGTMSNTGTFTIANNAVSNAKMATMADSTVKGNLSGGTTNPQNLTTTQLTSLIRLFGSLKGSVPGAPAPTVDSILTQVGWAKVIKSSLFADSNARIGGGVIRPSSAAGHAADIFWKWLGTSDGHDRYVLSDYIDAGLGSGPTVYFPTSGKIVTLIVGDDETLSQYGVIAGASVQLDNALIQTWVPTSNGGGYLVGNGTSTLTTNLNANWSISYTPGSGSIFLNNTASLIAAQGYFGVSLKYSGANNYHLKRLTSGLGSFNVGYQVLDASNTPVTSNLTSSDLIDVEGNGAPIMTGLPASTSNAFTDVVYSGTFANYWTFIIVSINPLDPDPPGTLTVVASGTAGQINLSWSAMAKATNYVVKRSIHANYGATTVFSGAGTSFNDTGLTTGVTYYYDIQATAASGTINNGRWIMNAGGTVAP